MSKLVRYIAAIYLAILGYVVLADSISKLSHPEEFDIQALFVLNIVYLLISLAIFYFVFALVRNSRKVFKNIIILLGMFYIFYVGQQIIWNKLIQSSSSELLNSALTWLLVYAIPMGLIYWNIKTETLKSPKK